MKEKIFYKCACVILCLIGASSCTHYQTQGAAVGGLIGAATGALVGNDSDDVLRGAAIGAAGGVGVAALDEENKRRAGVYNQGGDYYPSQTPPNPPRTQPSAYDNYSQYPVATKTANPEVVLSPFDPTREIGVKNYKSGDLAKDPVNQRVFRIP